MQVMEQWRRTLLDFLQEQQGPLILLATLFLIGVLFGSLAVKSLDSRDKLELVSYLGNGMTALVGSGAQSGTVPPGAMEAGAVQTGSVLLRQSLLAKARLLALYWVLGISLVGVLGVALITFLRGLVTGFVVTFLAAELGGRGLVIALLGHLPQSLLEVPALLLAGTASVVFSLQVIRSWRIRRRVPHFYPALAGYSMTLLKAGALLFLAALTESYLSPFLVRLAAGWFQVG